MSPGPGSASPLVYVCGPTSFVEAAAPSALGRSRSCSPRPDQDRALRVDGWRRRSGLVSEAALDGNAIAGSLLEVFGQEMTTVVGVCASCGTSAPVAEFVVHLRTPGVVAR